MKFCNQTKCQVVLTTAGNKTTVRPGDTGDINCGETAQVLLQHTYPSKALSKGKITTDGVSSGFITLDLLLALGTPAYFTIALDSTYTICADRDAAVCIEQQKSRRADCIYDRFYLQVPGGTVTDVLHTFEEKEQFKQHYKEAKQIITKKVLIIASILAGVLALFITILGVLANPVWGSLLGTVVSLIIAVLVALVWIFYWFTDKLDERLTFSDFESATIIKHFAKEKK